MCVCVCVCVCVWGGVCLLTYFNILGSFIFALCRFFICSLKSWSISRAFVTSPSHLLRYFRWASPLVFRGRQLKNFYPLRSSTRSTAEDGAVDSWYHLSILLIHTIFLLNYFKITRKTRINSRKLGQKLPAARHFDILCTFAVTWPAINQNKEFVLWSPPAFITSLPLLTMR